MKPFRFRSFLPAFLRPRSRPPIEPRDKNEIDSSRESAPERPRRRVIWLGSQITPIPIIFDDPPRNRSRWD